MSSSKRQRVMDYLREHEGATVGDVTMALGVSWATANKYIREANAAGWPKSAEEVEAMLQVTEGDTVEPSSAERVEGGVVVAAEYLATLEALRDQVIETQRLRRMLEGA